MLSITIRSFFLFIIVSHFGCSSKSAEQPSIPALKSEQALLTTQTDSGSINPSTISEEQPIEEGKMYLRNNWMNQIQIKKGSYKTGKENTGIFKLTAEVKNTLDYPVDSLLIFVSYFKGGNCVQVAPVLVRNIAAKETLTAKVPDNKEATRFQFQVRKVYSKALELCYDIDDYNRTGDDPYHCK